MEGSLFREADTWMTGCSHATMEKDDLLYVYIYIYVRVE